MNPKEYIELVKKTESIDFEAIRSRMFHAWNIRIDHASDGLVTETGEFKDAIKKFKFYGKEIDRVNCIEELGDILWYIGVACDVLNVSIEEVMEKNIAKLQKRYGITFNEEGAIKRDLSAERYILNKGLAVMCEHANEVPLNCKCSSDCYCKTHTCCIHYRTPGGSITSPCGVVATRYVYSEKETTCEVCRAKIYD